MKGRLRTYLFFIVSFNLLIGCGQTIYGQDEDAIKVETVLLNIPVFVNDRNGKPVKGLNKDDFELFINGQKQKIDFFADKGAVNIAIVIDANSNTSEVLDRMRRDAQQLVRLLGPDDRAMVIRFDIGYKVLAELTSDKSKLLRAIGGIDSHRERIRVMLGVMHQVVFREFAGVEGRKVVILLADPDSNLPAFSDKDREYVEKEPLRSHYENLTRSDVVIFPIFYQTLTFPKEYVGKTLNFSQLKKIPGLDYFNSFAELTGGRLYASGASNFKFAFEQILDEMRSQYVLGFHIDHDTNITSLKVSIKSDPYIVRSKQKISTISAGQIKLAVTQLWDLRK